MSRLSQAVAYIKQPTTQLTLDWVKTRMTDLEVNESLKKMRKEYISNTKKS
jgi:hypothetical protein